LREYTWEGRDQADGGRTSIPDLIGADALARTALRITLDGDRSVRLFVCEERRESFVPDPIEFGLGPCRLSDGLAHLGADVITVAGSQTGDLRCQHVDAAPAPPRNDFSPRVLVDV